MNMKQKERVKPVTVLLGAVVLVGAYAGNSVAQEPVEESNAEACVTAGNDVCVNIRFDSDGCPQTVDNDGFIIDGSKFVVWQSVELASPYNPTEVEFSIYFDPFKSGNPLNSNKGRKKSQQIDGPATRKGIEYKYTILGLECADPEKAPLDPRFTVRR